MSHAYAPLSLRAHSSKDNKHNSPLFIRHITIIIPSDLNIPNHIQFRTNNILHILCIQYYIHRACLCLVTSSSKSHHPPNLQPLQVLFAHPNLHLAPCWAVPYFLIPYKFCGSCRAHHQNHHSWTIFNISPKTLNHHIKSSLYSIA